MGPIGNRKPASDSPQINKTPFNPCTFHGSLSFEALQLNQGNPFNPSTLHDNFQDEKVGVPDFRATSVMSLAPIMVSIYLSISIYIYI
jgi:hypothetical protein